MGRPHGNGRATIMGIGKALPEHVFEQKSFPDYYFDITDSKHLVDLKARFRVGYSAASARQCMGCASLCLSEGEPYIRRSQKPSGPNLLDEPLKGFIVIFVCSPWKCFGSYKPRHMGIMTHSESVQPLHSVKLVYQPCSRSRAALEHL